MVRPLHIKNANIWSDNDIEQRELYCSDVILEQSEPDSVVVDLEGYTIFPGLINAHDHLELNHYPRTKFREVYNNAHEWGEDVNSRLDTEPYKSLRQYPIWDRLFIGGLKNLLCGATTVAHHGPKYREMYRKDFPVRVLRDYGWSHSLHFDTEEEILKSYQSTPKNHPWFIHLAEGTDDIAKSEYRRLKALGCVSENTVIVYGVGLLGNDLLDASDLQNIHGIVVCPTTNKYLLNACPKIDLIAEAGINIFIGSDSRLTASGDIFNELHALDLDVSNNWFLLTQPLEFLEPKSIADLLVIDNKLPLHQQNRGKIKAVLTSGIPQIGDPDIMAQFPHIETVSALLDGVPKSINIALARQIQKCKLKERGLELLEIPKKRFWFI